MTTKSNKKTILITGGKGFIGSNFLSFVSNLKGDTSKKLNYRIFAPTHKKLDILDKEKLKNAFEKYRPEVVINFAAYRDANSAEKQRYDKRGPVWRTNVEGVENLATACKQYRCFLIHISTDMVFSGKENNPGPYDEEKKPEEDMHNLSWYGWTKAEAERMLMKDKEVAIIRIGNVTQPIYDPKLDYVGKILYLFDHGELYPLFNDQYLTLTYIPSVLELIETLVVSRKPGIFHIASKNIFTPYKLCEYLIRKARCKTNVLLSISIKEYLKKSPNRYPQYGGLLAKKTSEQFHLKLFDWEQIVNFYIEKMNSPFY